uniref:Integrator complex subunit 7 n=1 Tax=Oryza brachyantha TaxID=4533 RepID=J3MDU3_ORYBR
MDKLPAASAMQWSIDLDRALRSRHAATRLHALDDVPSRLRELGASPSLPPAVASALGVLPSEPRLFAQTMVLRLATEFRSSDNAVRACIVRALLLEYRDLATKGRGYDGALARSSVAEPHQVLRRIKPVYDAGCPRARALALRMFGCLAHLAEDSLHVRSLILSSLSSSIAVEVGKQIVLGTLEDNFKAGMLLSLSRLAAKSVILFGDQVELLLLFLEHESSHCVKTVSLKCLCFMFNRSIYHFPVLRTVFRKLLQLIDHDDFPLDCRRYAFMVLQKIVCGKAPIVHCVDTSELSKLVLAAESSLHSSSWEMQGISLKVIAGTLCLLQKTSSDQNMITQEGSSLAYSGCQEITNNLPPTHIENVEDKFVRNIVISMVNHNISLVNPARSTGNKEEARRHTYVSSELKMHRSMLVSMLKLVACYPSAAAVALDKLRCLIKELVRIDDSGCSNSVTNDIIKPVAANIKASLMETDFDKVNTDSSKFSGNKEVSIVHNIILLTLNFANACHNMLCKRSGINCNLYDSIKELIECVQQNASQYFSTYESFHLIMCACISWNGSKIRDDNQESGDSKEQPRIFFTPSVWITQELSAIRMTKMLFRKQKYWDAYKSAMYCCHEGLWFAASFIFRKLADAFGSGSFSFWFKSLLYFSAGEIEMKLLIFPSATVKLVRELKTECDLHDNFYCVETSVDVTLGGSSELHGSEAKISAICSKTFLPIEALLSNNSSSHKLFFQRWFICLRASFVEILTDFLGILTSHFSTQKNVSDHQAAGDHSSVPREHCNSQILALANCSLGLSDLAQSYDLLAVSHGDMDHQSFSRIARLAFICSLLSFCIAFSVDFSKVHMSVSVESCRLPERFSHAKVIRDLHERVDRTDSQIVSQLQQLMPISCDEGHSIQIVTRMDCSGILEKDSYLLCKYAVAYLHGTHEDHKGVTIGEDSFSPLHGGMQFLSSILQRVMELPFVVPRYLFRVRPCFGAELNIYDTNPANREGISVLTGFQLSLTLCLHWKCVLERSSIEISKLYCVLATSSASCLHATTGTRSKKEYEMHKSGGMVELNTLLQQYIMKDENLTKSWDSKKKMKKNVEMVTAFARFEASSSGMGFSSCVLDVSAFRHGSYRINWHACCIDKDGSYYSLLPLNDGAVFAIRNSSQT